MIVHAVALSQSGSNAEITVGELREHVKFLASDKLEGRRAGSKGADRAADYIRQAFRSYGLVPVGDNGSYFQRFEFVAGIKLGSSNKLSFSIAGRRSTLAVDQDFRPLGFSSSETYEGELLFAGYGISAPDKNYDDYSGLDVKGKAVIVLRNAPPSDTARDFAQYASLRYKAGKAKELGAKAMIVVTGPEDSEMDDLIKLSYDQATGNAGIVALHVTRKRADELLLGQQKKIKDLQKNINQSRSPHSFVVAGSSVSATVDLQEIRQTTANVAGLIEGSDAVLKDQVLVIGAHYDHLGFGGEGSGSLKPDTIAVHNGADDNASGTAGLLELAQAFAAQRTMLNRSILFMTFSGEELGLLGSARYVKNPLVPIERTVAMLNMDMIGRMNNRSLIVYGIGTSPGFEELAKRNNKDSTFVLKLNKDGYGPSDHASFYGKQIPVFHFFTDLHSDYHRPSDDYDKLNYQGMADVVRYVEAITKDLDDAKEKPQYVAVEAPRPAGAGRSSRVFMGTIPDFGEQVEGMKLSGVREGSPAAKCGLQGGDVIVKFGKVDIKNLYDFTYALGEYKPGDEVEVVFKRGDETRRCRVTLERRN